MAKVRLDQLLVEQGYFQSREKAKKHIMAGLVYTSERQLDKPGEKLSPDIALNVKSTGPTYASRGGYKLEKALNSFAIQVDGRVILDVGASTGGFTDCLLSYGASHVHAIDVGYGQMAWHLRQDERVSVFERSNIRYVDKEQFCPKPDMATIDVSFISLKSVIPIVNEILNFPKDIIVLVKPQFEANKSQIGKKGVVKHSETHKHVLKEALKYIMNELDFMFNGITFSPVTGPQGNIEFLACFTRSRSESIRTQSTSVDEIVGATVDQAHAELS